MVNSVYFNGFYEASWHIFFYLFITTHICLFVDASPLQKHPTCKLNFIIVCILTAIIPSAITNMAKFPTFETELGVGIGSALVLSVIGTLTIQRIIDIDIDF